MKLVVDQFNDSSTFTPSSAAVTLSDNEVPELIAWLNDASVLAEFAVNSSGEYFEKDLSGSPIDVTDYTELVFTIWAQRTSICDADNKPSDYYYSLTINDTNTFYIPATQIFESVTIGIENITEITKLKITALTNTKDALIISHMAAVADELPVDIFRSVKEQLDYDITQKFEDNFLIGTFDGSAGQNRIYLKSGNREFIEKYTVIRIDDGVNEEIHQIERTDQREFIFNSNFDGPSLLNSYTDANVYLYIPVNYGTMEKEVILPGIAIWGMTPEPILRNSKLENIFDSYTSAGPTNRLGQQILDYLILLHCEGKSEQTEIVALMSQICRSFIAREVLWMNGKKYYIRFEGSPTYLEPTENTNQMQKIQWEFRIEVKEEIRDRQSLTLISANNINIYEEDDPNG